MKVHEILFVLWVIVFAFWLFKQFARSNKKYDAKRKA